MVVPEPYATAVVRPFVAPETGRDAPREPTLPVLPLESLLPLEFELPLEPEVSELPDLPDDPDFPPPFPPPPFRRYNRWALGFVTPGTYMMVVLSRSIVTLRGAVR